MVEDQGQLNHLIPVATVRPLETGCRWLILLEHNLPQCGMPPRATSFKYFYKVHHLTKSPLSTLQKVSKIKLAVMNISVFPFVKINLEAQIYII
jgi:hypothetical protein